MGNVATVSTGIVGDTGPLTTGTFTDFSEADSETPHSGPQYGPPIPDEDFLRTRLRVKFFLYILEDELLLSL